MSHRVILPKLTHDMETGVVLEWYRQEGDAVETGDRLLAVETDKAAVDVEAEACGRLAGVRARAGQELRVGDTLAWILASGEEVPQEETAAERSRPEDEAGVRQQRADGTKKLDADATAGGDPGAGGRIVASPLARRIARNERLDLSQVEGSGPRGRIVAADVRAYAATTERRRLEEGAVPYEVVPLSRLRRKIGERMVASSRSAPRFDLEVEVDMAEAARWRRRAGDPGETRISYTAMLVRAIAAALVEHPRLNSTFVDSELRVHRQVNVGVAVATPAGLLVPVIHRADELRVPEIQAAITGLREKAEAQRFAADDLGGGTFTLSNLGMLGIDAFRAIINPPEAAILAVGRVRERPVAVNGELVVRPTMRAVLSVDHRVVDGAQAAPFLTAVQRYLENPYQML